MEMLLLRKTTAVNDGEKTRHQSVVYGWWQHGKLSKFLRSVPCMPKDSSVLTKKSLPWPFVSTESLWSFLWTVVDLWPPRSSWKMTQLDQGCPNYSTKDHVAQNQLWKLSNMSTWKNSCSLCSQVIKNAVLNDVILAKVEQLIYSLLKLLLKGFLFTHNHFNHCQGQHISHSDCMKMFLAILIFQLSWHLFMGSSVGSVPTYMSCSPPMWTLFLRPTLSTSLSHFYWSGFHCWDLETSSIVPNNSYSLI